MNWILNLWVKTPTQPKYHTESLSFLIGWIFGLVSVNLGSDSAWCLITTFQELAMPCGGIREVPGNGHPRIWRMDYICKLCFVQWIRLVICDNLVWLMFLKVSWIWDFVCTYCQHGPEWANFAYSTFEKQNAIHIDNGKNEEKSLMSLKPK